MPPKRRRSPRGQVPLEALPALQGKGYLDDMIKGVIFGLHHAGRTMADIADCCHVSVSTVSRTVKDVGAILGRSWEEAQQEAKAQPPAPETPSAPRVGADGTYDHRTSSDLVYTAMYTEMKDGTFKYKNCREIRQALVERFDRPLSVRQIQRLVSDHGGDWVRRPRTSPLTPERMKERVQMATILSAKRQGYSIGSCLQTNASSVLRIPSCTHCDAQGMLSTPYEPPSTPPRSMCGEPSERA